jgi:hypothetical protein
MNHGMWQLHIFDRVRLLFCFYLIQVQFSGLECVVQFARKVHILAGNNPNPTLIISIFLNHHFAVAFSRQNLHHVSPRSASLLSVTQCHIFMSARDGSSKHHTTMHWNLSTSMTWTKYDQSMSVFLHTR